MDKSPLSYYLPDNSKRWLISKDQYSRERLQVLKEAHLRIQTEFAYSNSEHIPFGFSLYGSLTKGKRLTKENQGLTDVDMYIFYDHDILLERWSDVIENNPAGIFSQFFRTRKNQMSNYDEAAMSSASATILQTIDNAQVDSLRDLPYKNEYFGMDGFKVSPISLQGEHSILTAVKDNIDDLFKEYDIDGFFEVAKYFHLDLGGGLKPYIREFIKTLKNLDSVSTEGHWFTGEGYWQAVNLCVKAVERKGDISPHLQRQFPHTLDEAVKYYGKVQKII